MAMPSEAALAGSKSDAESVTIATRPTASPPSALPGVRGMIRAEGAANRASVAWTPASLWIDGSISVGRAGRHLHAALQHRAHGRDADLLPRRPEQPPRRPGSAARLRTRRGAF